jgi:hypothetical protein
MIALRSQYYGRDLKAGEMFEVTEEHAALLERTGAAEREPKPKKEYRTRVMEAEK